MYSRLKVKGVNKTKKKIDLFFKKKIKDLQMVVEMNATRIQKRARKKVPKDTGKLTSSIQVKYINHRLVAEIYSKSKIALYVEYGTRPHYPPPRALKGWAMRHGFKRGAEFAIANKIAKYGTKPQPFLFPAFFKTRKEFIKDVEAVVKKK